MKALFILTITFLSMTAHAKTLTKPFKIKLISVDERVDFKKYEPAMRVSCNFKMLQGTGEIWSPQIPTIGTGSCGAYNEKIVLNANNELEIPSLRPTDNNQGYKIKNLIVAITLTDKSNNGSKEFLAIKTAGKEGINQLVENKEPINVFTANVNGINVSYEGADFFGSELALHKSGHFDLKFTNYKTAAGRIFIESAYTKTRFAAFNSYWPEAHNKLSEVKVVDMGELVFAQLGNRVEKADIELNYYNEELRTLRTPKVSIPVTVESLESIKSLSLK